MLLLRELAQRGLLGWHEARGWTSSFTELKEAWLEDLVIIGAGLLPFYLVVAGRLVAENV